MEGICKFCGCTDATPCVVAGEPCAWLLPNVCTAPACVEKAYHEATADLDRMVAAGELPEES